MNFLLLGSQFFKESLESLGHKAITCGSNESCDILVDVTRTPLRDLLRQIPEGKDLDFIILFEYLGEKKVFPKGIEESPIPTAFYSIDTHLNFFWHREFARAFDLVLTTQKDYVRRFKKHGIKGVFWLPWAVDTTIFKDYELKRNHDIVFIGTLDPSSRRKRSYLIEEMAKRFNLRLFGIHPDRRLSPHEMAKVYSQAKIVLNESILGEINFRVFEAMACGPLLLTEKVENGLPNLFKDHQHLVTYDHRSVFQLADYYLENSKERDLIAKSGKELVAKKHSRAERAKAFVQILKNHASLSRGRKTISTSQSLGKAYYYAGLRYWNQTQDLFRRAAILFQRGKRSDARDWISCLYLGMVYANCNEWAKAEENYIESIRIKSDYFHSHVLLANAYAAQGKLKKAREQYLMAGKCAPGSPRSLRQKLEQAADRDILDARFNFYLGRMYEKNGMTLEVGFLKKHPDPAASSAVEYYNKSITLDPTYTAPWQALGNLLFKWEFYSDAIPVFEGMTRAAPQDAEAHYKLGLCYTYCYKSREAGRELFKSYHLNPKKGKKVASELRELSDREKGLAMLELGHAFYDIDAFDEARKRYKKAVAYDPENAETYAYLGIAHIKLGHLALARWNLERSLEIDPENPHIPRLLDKIQLEGSEQGRI